MSKFLNELIDFNTDLNSAHVIGCIDMHTGGEPLRVIRSGFAPLEGKRIVEKRLECLEKQDHLRTAIIGEPRGHADMYGALITQSERDDSDFGVLFLHNEGYSTMCGHAIIALSTLAEKMGHFLTNDTLKIDTPAGQVTAYNKNGEAFFDNVASYVVALDHQITHADFGTFNVDVAFGGAYYAYVDADKLDISLSKANAAKLSELGEEIKALVNDSLVLSHPEDESLSFLYGVIFYSSSQTKDKQSHSKHVCIFADGELDRSPTGTGVSARAAILHARGQLNVGDKITIESIVDSSFDVTIQEETQFQAYNAVIPRVFGTAFITAFTNFILDDTDPFKNGFFLK